MTDNQEVIFPPAIKSLLEVVDIYMDILNAKNLDEHSKKNYLLSLILVEQLIDKGRTGLTPDIKQEVNIRLDNLRGKIRNYVLEYGKENVKESLNALGEEIKINFIH